MIKIHEVFLTKALAEAWAAHYKSQYHPCGYGTTLDIIELDDERWLVSGHRFNSCD